MFREKMRGRRQPFIFHDFIQLFSGQPGPVPAFLSSLATDEPCARSCRTTWRSMRVGPGVEQGPVEELGDVLDECEGGAVVFQAADNRPSCAALRVVVGTFLATGAGMALAGRGC